MEGQSLLDLPGRTNRPPPFPRSGAPRTIEERDVEAVSELYHAVYGDDFPFRELALLEGAPRMATVRARTAVRGLHIDPGDFHRRVRDDPAIGAAIYRNVATTLSRRLRGD